MTTEVGRCGARSPQLVPREALPGTCRLPHGHPGWHHSDSGCEWTNTPLLTPVEHDAVRLAGELWNALCAAIPDGPTRDADLHELIHHVHAIQHAVMANAAARAYPELYRPLGGTLRAQEDRP